MLQVLTSTIVIAPIVSKNASQIPDKTEGSLLLPAKVRNNSNDQEIISCAAISLNPHLLILDAGQYSTRMRCHFHHQHNYFLDYIDDPVMDGAVIYAGDIPIFYSGIVKWRPYMHKF